MIGTYKNTEQPTNLCYADNVISVSPTLTSVKLLLLKVVESFGEEYFVNFNSSKINLVKFGTSNQMYCNDYLIFNYYKYFVKQMLVI